MNVLVLVIFGGMGSIWGVALGAIVIQTATSYLDNYQPWGYQINDLYMYIGALLIIMMIFRPAGLLPSRRRAREFAAAEGGEEIHTDEVLGRIRVTVHDVVTTRQTHRRARANGSDLSRRIADASLRWRGVACAMSPSTCVAARSSR